MPTSKAELWETLWLAKGSLKQPGLWLAPAASLTPAWCPLCGTSSTLGAGACMCLASLHLLSGDVKESCDPQGRVSMMRGLPVLPALGWGHGRRS